MWVRLTGENLGQIPQSGNNGLMHATDYLKNPAKHADAPVVVLIGDERFLQRSVLDELKQQVLAGDELGLTEFDGKDVKLKSVMDELRTVSMWGDKRLVVVDRADDFVTEHRPKLETYVNEPARKSVLVLVVKKFPKTTRLYKAADKAGLVVQCEPLKSGALVTWLSGQAKDEFSKTLDRPAANLMVELVGENLGRLSQELDKLANYVGDRAAINADDVAKLVGGWKAETTWALVDAIMVGRVGEALGCLEKLLAAREAPLMIVGGMAFKFRQLFIAADLARGGKRLNAALTEAGVWRNQLGISESYLRRIGRPRAEQIGRLLLNTRDRLGGGAGSLTRDQERITMERLIVALGGD